MMSSPSQRPPPRGTGDDSRDAVADVLRDQAERAERRERSGAALKSRRAPLGALAAGLAALSAWLWLAPPDVIVPDAPTPSVEDVERGLRMRMYVTFMAVERFAGLHGRYPSRLADLSEPTDSAVDYRPLGPQAYRLVGSLGGLELRWDSTQPVSDLIGGVVGGGGAPRNP